MELLREAELEAHQAGQHERDEPDEDRDDGVLDRDDLVVLAPDVLQEERVGIVNRGIAIRNCDVGHQFVLGSSVLM